MMTTSNNDPTPTHATTTRTKVYLHEESIANDFGQVIQKRKTLSGRTTNLSWSDHFSMFQQLPTTCPQALYLGLAAGLGSLWICGRMRGVLARRHDMTSPFRNSEASGLMRVRSTVGALDFLLSGWIGYKVTFNTINPMAKQKMIADLPLQPQSGIAENLCGELMKEYQRQLKLDLQQNPTQGELSRRSTFKQPRRDDLKILFQFIDNCQKRQQLVGNSNNSLGRLEKEWREEGVLFSSDEDDSRM